MSTGSEFLDAAIRAGALVTGPPVGPDFERGWAHQPFMLRMVAHRWSRSHVEPDGSYVGFNSACGLLTVATPRVPLLTAGNLPYCQRCENKLLKETR